jgi:hypothetical protein
MGASLISCSSDDLVTSNDTKSKNPKPTNQELLRETDSITGEPVIPWKKD